MKTLKISAISKLLLFIGSAFLVISLFVPIWSIYLDAPQYPEGLGLQIWANKIAGDVDIINGLNHYIGMKTLHTEDFIEFTVLPYIIVAFAVLFALAALLGKKKFLYFLFGAFVVFGIVAMADFYRWEYDYGHNLDPNAAIKVPGMAYQPPLIGFKQLLNFGAYSIPNIGGWLFILAGLLSLTAVLIETKFLKKFSKNKSSVAVLLPMIWLLSSCGTKKAEPIALNKDACTYCKMSISDGKFGAEIITKKGRVYKFDDIVCMNGYLNENDTKEVQSFFIADYAKDNHLIDASTAVFVQHESFKSPMGGNIAAFESKTEAEKIATVHKTTTLNWDILNKQISKNVQHNEQ